MKTIEENKGERAHLWKHTIKSANRLEDFSMNLSLKNPRPPQNEMIDRCDPKEGLKLK
jgi:hypothetical protein